MTSSICYKYVSIAVGFSQRELSIYSRALATLMRLKPLNVLPYNRQLKLTAIDLFIVHSQSINYKDVIINVMNTPEEGYKDEEHLPIRLMPEEVSEEQIKKSWDAISKAITEDNASRKRVRRMRGES